MLVVRIRFGPGSGYSVSARCPVCRREVGSVLLNAPEWINS